MEVRDIPNTLPRPKCSFTPKIFNTLKKLHSMPFIDILTNILAENIGIVITGRYKSNLDDSIFYILSDKVISGINMPAYNAC